MMILIKKAVRDLLRHKMRTISIMIAIALSVGLGIGLVNATRNAFDSFDKRLEVTNYEDIDIMFDMTRINMSAVRDISGVEEVCGRVFIETQVQYGNERYKTHWISSPYHEEKPYSTINGYQMVKGDYVSSMYAREALVGHLFADANGVEPGDDLKVSYGNLTFELNVSGVAASPEYVYAVSDEGWPEPSHLLPLFTTYEMTSKVLELEDDTYNELLIKVADGHDVESVKESLEENLTGMGVRITRSILGTEETDYLFSRSDAKGMGQMGWVFGTIILVVTSVVIYNSMTKLISSQRAYIGVMGALGGRKRDILGHYSLFGLFMGASGSILGIPLGIGISKLTITEYADIIGLIDPSTNTNWNVVLLFFTIGAAIATLGAFLGSLKAVRIGPREALTSQYTTLDYSRKPLLERLFDLLFRSRPILPRIPLRNLSRHKLRTTVTLLSLGVSLILVFASLALSFGFTQPLEDNYDKYEKWDLKVTLINPIPAEDAVSILRSPSFEGTGAEVTLDDYLPILDGDGMGFARIQAFDSDSKLRNFHVIEGRYDPERGVLVGSVFAHKEGFKVGDEATFVIGNRTASVLITGITGELLDDSFLMTLDQAWELLGAGRIVNALILNLGDRTKDSIESLVRDNFAVSSFLYTDDVINGMESMLQGIIVMFFMFIGFGIVAEVLFISTTVVLNILDRDMEFVSLRAIGARPRKIMRMIVLETMILLTGGLIIGLPLGVLTTKWAMAYMVKDLMYYVINVDPIVYVISAVIAVLSALISSYISARYITKIQLVDIIRQRSI